jgi:hypothetical protein
MGLKNNKNIPADVRRTIVEELGHHTSVSVVHPCCFGNGYRWDWIEAWEYPNHLVLFTRKFFHTGQILLAIRETEQRRRRDLMSAHKDWPASENKLKGERRL